jgi:glucose-6-phosphate 1-dehydrogenase
MNDLTVSDPVADGIREWNRVKQSAADATARAERAEQEAGFLRGQLAVLQSQNERNDQELKQLRGQVEEMKMYISEGAAIFADVVQKMKAGAFRRPGSREVVTKAIGGEATERFRKLEQALDGAAAEIGAKHGANNPRVPALVAGS